MTRWEVRNDIGLLWRFFFNTVYFPLKHLCVSFPNYLKHSTLLVSSSFHVTSPACNNDRAQSSYSSIKGILYSQKDFMLNSCSGFVVFFNGVTRIFANCQIKLCHLWQLLLVTLCSCRMKLYCLFMLVNIKVTKPCVPHMVSMPLLQTHPPFSTRTQSSKFLHDND